jgi:hypothetical protein
MLSRKKMNCRMSWLIYPILSFTWKRTKSNAWNFANPFKIKSELRLTKKAFPFRRLVRNISYHYRLTAQNCLPYPLRHLWLIYQKITRTPWKINQFTWNWEQRAAQSSYSLRLRYHSVLWQIVCSWYLRSWELFYWRSCL